MCPIPPARKLAVSRSIRPPRAFRVKIRGSVLTLLQLPNRRLVRGKLHQVSTTGGLLNVDQPLDEKLQLDLIFHLKESTIRERVEMLFPMWATQGWLQPFRFVNLPEASKEILESSLRALINPGDQDRAPSVAMESPAQVLAEANAVSAAMPSVTT
jgi:hypothetical protein